jgi:UDP-GlcNAc:undecaprenyl-phosphate GlcNAc-1-phosphate transferase
MDPLESALSLGLAFGVTYAVTPLVARFARAIGAVDRPSERGVSQRSDMPLLGGLAVFAGITAGVLLAFARLTEVDLATNRLVGLMLGLGILVGVGIWDDRFGMKAWPKFTFQIIAAVIAIASGFEISRLTDPITLNIVELPTAVGWAASLLWIVGITNALNLIDGLDGLASGVGAIIGGTLTLIAWQAGQPFGVCVGVALVGALLGFLPYNFAPARIFLGDTGSLLIGFSLSLLALDGYRRVSVLTFVVPLLALAVPILDTTISIVRRIRTRRPIFLADRQHMHHRLLESEGSARSAVLQFYLLTGAFCMIALSFTQLSGYVAAFFLFAVGGLTLRMLRNLGVLAADGERGHSGAEENK